MTGTLALIGGGEFAATEAVDRELLDRSGAECVVVVPTADAYERPERSVTRAQAWFESLGVASRGLDVLRRPDAFSPEHVATVSGSAFLYLVGDSPMHLRSVLKDTPLLAALVEAVAGGAVVAASGPAAMALCDPMTDPRGGAFTLGLGLARPMAVVPAAESWSHDRLHRTLGLGLAFPVVTLATGAAVLRGPDGWKSRGDAVVHLAGSQVDVDALPLS